MPWSTSPSPSTTPRTTTPKAPEKADKPNLLERMGQGLKNVAGNVVSGAERLVDRFEAKLPDLSGLKPANLLEPWKGITLTGKPLQIPLEPAASLGKLLPSLVHHKSDRATLWREAEIRVVNSQQQSMLGARGEHAIGLEASARN